MKRISILVQYKNHPETLVSGYALSHEIQPKQVSFFAAQKFPIDEELIVFYTAEGEKKSISVKLNHMHEQISSGRVMNSLPDDQNPFPARKFYRCYTQVLSAGETTATTTEAETPVAAVAETPAPEAAPETPATEETKAA